MVAELGVLMHDRLQEIELLLGAGQRCSGADEIHPDRLVTRILRFE